MEIIKKGKIPEEKDYRAECRKCKTEFIFKKSEAKLKTDGRDGYNYYVLNCPLCNLSLTIGSYFLED